MQTMNQLKDSISVYACNGQCSKCGNCCTDFLPVTKKEISKIKRYVKENNIKAENRIIEGNIILQCPFLNQKTKQCNIYEVRPFVCRNFLCSHKDWRRKRKLYMERADYNGTYKNGKIKPIYSMDELVFDNLEFFFYYIESLCRCLPGGTTKENFELVIKKSQRKEILNYIKFKEGGKENAKESTKT